MGNSRSAFASVPSGDEMVAVLEEARARSMDLLDARNHQDREQAKDWVNGQFDEMVDSVNGAPGRSLQGIIYRSMDVIGWTTGLTVLIEVWLDLMAVRNMRPNRPYSHHTLEHRMRHG